MKKTLMERLARLLCVKSMVTLILTVVFSIMALTGEIFYFGTQLERTAQKGGGAG